MSDKVNKLKAEHARLHTELVECDNKIGRISRRKKATVAQKKLDSNELYSLTRIRSQLNENIIRIEQQIEKLEARSDKLQEESDEKEALTFQERKQKCIDALVQTGQRREQAAKLLGIGARQFYVLMNRYGIERRPHCAPKLVDVEPFSDKMLLETETQNVMRFICEREAMHEKHQHQILYSAYRLIHWAWKNDLLPSVNLHCEDYGLPAKLEDYFQQKEEKFTCSDFDRPRDGRVREDARIH